MSLNAISLPTGLPFVLPANHYFRSQNLFQLPNGNFVATYASILSGFVPGISYQTMLLDANGVAIGAPETVFENVKTFELSPYNTRTAMEVLPLAGGGYGLVFHQLPTNAEGYGYGGGSGWAMVEWFNASGVSLGAPQQLSGTPSPVFLPVVGGQDTPTAGVADVAVAYSNGHSFVVWYQPPIPNAPGSPGATASAVYVREVDAGGNAIGSPVLVNSPYPIATIPLSINAGDVTATPLANGQTLVTWAYNHQTAVDGPPGPNQITTYTSTNAVHGRLLDSSGAPIGNELTLATLGTATWPHTQVPGPSINQIASLQVVGLSGGGFAMVWVELNDGTFNADFKVQAFTAAGAPIGTGDVLVDDYNYSNSLLYDAVTSFQVTELANGGFAVGFNMAGPVDVNGQRLEQAGQVQVYDGNGQRSGGLIAIPGRDQDGPVSSPWNQRDTDTDFVLRSDGTVLVIGVDGNNLSFYPFTQIFDFLSTVAAATTGDDLVVLTSHDNYYGGRAGNDAISGLGGNDILFGDSGNDTLLGGEGTDQLHGGIGNDALQGGSGNDDLYGGNDDTLGARGNDLADFGDATGSVVATLGAGGSGSVTALGIGTDTLYEIESLAGGAFDDTLTGDDANSRLLGRGGHDVLSGGFGNDTLIGDGALLPTANANSVYRLYLATLARGPDDGGHVNWTMLLDAGSPLTSVAAGFVGSQEFLNVYGAGLSNNAFVELLYNNVLHRASDPGGLANWVAALNGGSSRENVVVGFSESTEFQITSNTADDFGQIYRLYGATLDRAPDPGGFENWLAAMYGGMTLETAAGGFVGSQEFQGVYGALDNTQFVTLLYANVLDRAPDQGGLDAWLAQLGGGASRASVVVGFSESAEYQNNTGAALTSFMRTALPSWNDTLEGGINNDSMAGGRGSDTYVFRTGEGGIDHVYGIEAWDTLSFQGYGYANAAAAQSHMSQAGADVVFTDLGETITFHDATLARLNTVSYVLA